jgi:hypothetical protein
MPTFVIERAVPEASKLSKRELQEIARTSNEVVAGLGVPYTWLHSYVAGDKIYCVHRTDNADTIREHANRGGFPADLVVEVAAVINPSTGEEG